jgi:hypothetical protein
MIFVWLICLAALVAVLLIVEKRLTPGFKGAVGEQAVAAKLKELPEADYHVINNVMLATDRGTTQIDHVVVARTGIFVIETKNYKGWITGSGRADTWTQNIYGRKKAFKNPIHQNYGHIKAIEQLLGEGDELPMVSIVAFPGDCELKVQATSHVVTWGNVVSTIRSYMVPKIDADEVAVIADKIAAANVDSKESRVAHVRQVREKTAARAAKIEAGICPRCGGTLVERQGKYGAFWGCSNYPKCRYTKKKE